MIGGIITSSLLTLVGVPVIYTCLDDLACWVQNKIRAGRAADAGRSLIPLRSLPTRPTRAGKSCSGLPPAEANRAM